MLRTTIALLFSASLSACGIAPSDRDAALQEGPPIADIVTPFDDALVCLKGKISPQFSFAVGGIPDQTGSYQNSGEGTGKFVTQGAGDIVQSALFKTGVTLINRRDIGTSALESQWGLLDLSRQTPAMFVITGSINSLDFIPGGGAGGTIGGIGPTYRQNRILVGLDLAVTNVRTGRIVANVALRKQIFADEFGLLTAKYLNNLIVDFEIGMARREAMNYALRQMLQLATYELLTQMMPAEKYVNCAPLVDPRHGKVSGDMTTAEQLRQLEERKAQDAEDVGSLDDSAVDAGEPVQTTDAAQPRVAEETQTARASGTADSVAAKEVEVAERSDPQVSATSISDYTVAMGKSDVSTELLEASSATATPDGEENSVEVSRASYSSKNFGFWPFGRSSEPSDDQE